MGERTSTLASLISLVSNLVAMVCLGTGVLATLKVFTRGGEWVQENIYQPVIAGQAGGLGLYLLTYFYGFGLWITARICAAISPRMPGPYWKSRRRRSRDSLERSRR